MNQLRVTVQTALNEVVGVDSGVPVPDNVVEEGTTYFGYEFQTAGTVETYNRDYSEQIVLIGRVVRVDSPDENTLAIVDDAVQGIADKLRALNFSVDTKDITLEQNIRKVQISATATYDSMNNTLVL